MDRQAAIELLHSEKCSCVIVSGSTVTICRERGVKDLFRILESEKHLLDGAFIADKVIGKGAAALMILGGVVEVYADVISRPALALLESAGVAVSFGSLTDNIINRAGTDICPVEKLCSRAGTAGECLPLIQKFISTINPEKS